ncbi:hypothetical protein KBI31_01700 [Patescibacteria group bacterium]|jgi:hypothetical protein|nr:hypothetical protein [Patescibacteria group bacterium]HPD07839.1 hypothetical protein [bacterium]HRT11230.1 hypothetical protein [Patescibacteria group bacterium]HRU90029.1 hypothetical protein [Patescibacteria group bacterium]
MVKTRQLFIWLLSLGVLIIPFTTKAFVGRTGNEVTFGPADQLNGVTYALGQQITIDTPLPDDLICLGGDVFINQPVAGDVICAAENLNIKAPVGGSVRLFGSNLNIDSQIGRNAILSGSQLLLGDNSEIKGETLLANLLIESRGIYRKAVHGLYGQAKLAGHYEAPIDLKEIQRGASQLIVDPTANIGAGLSYRAEKSAQIDSGAHINGEVVHKVATAQEKRAAMVGWWWSRFLHLFMLLVTALVLYSLWPKLGERLVETGKHKAGLVCFYGFLTLFILPIIAIAAGFTIIGIPLALIALAIWCFLIYIGCLVPSYWLGLKIIPKAKNHLWPFLLGATIIVAIGWIPFIGQIITMLATWWGVGAIEQTIFKAHSTKKANH